MKHNIEQFTPSEIGVAVSEIPAGHRPVIHKLVEAARVLDGLFLRQVSETNPAVREEIAREGLASTLAYFDIMYGPWDRLDGDAPFYGDRPKPAGAAFYPADLSPDELEAYLTEHPMLRPSFESYFTVIRRTHDGLAAVPYSEAYRPFLESAAGYLKEAAALTRDPRLKRYLETRASAFATDEYRESDMAWMSLGESDIEVVMGPYEVYEDGLLGLKASFEAFIALRDKDESDRLAAITAMIPEMEAYLPLPDEHRNARRGAASPISVVNLLFSAGDCRAGIQTMAFNLPNDEVVREMKGSKKVMLRNVAEAKFRKILVPIAERMMRPSQLAAVTFDAFFHHTLVHETAHGLGPGRIRVATDPGVYRETTVNQALKERYSVIEEAKADVLGMYLNYLLMEKGLRKAEFEREMIASFLGGFFRSVRFGADEAHGQANVIQFNYLVEQGAVVRDPDGRYGAVAGEMRVALASLARELLLIEALGDYEAAGRFIAQYGAMPARLREDLARLKDIPVDIRPVYTVEEQMASW